MIGKAIDEYAPPNGWPRPPLRQAAAAWRRALRWLPAIILCCYSCAAAAGQPRIVDGNYLRYESTQFESIFLPCSSTEVWSINGGDALHALVDYYRNSRANPAAEIRAALLLDILPVNRAEQPDAQIDAAATVIAVLSISEMEGEIDSCREE